METTTIELPAMYADHHVQEVRRILLEMPGVEEVYASSGFQVAEITYDSEKIKLEALEEVLGTAGYLVPLPVLTESEVAGSANSEAEVFFRHTAAFEQTGQTVGFGQDVASQRPLWPCPGIGPTRTMAD